MSSRRLLAGCRARATGEPRRAFTVVELLVVCSMLCILLALLLPAVQAARERSRRTTCLNRLRQLILAAQSHQASHQHLPTGGWGYRWVGDANRGYGSEQPGGWIFNLLPYLEHSDVRDLGRGKHGAELHAAGGRMLQMPLAGLHCPSRRASRLLPYSEADQPLYNAAVPPLAAKSDYAVNGGDREVGGGSGPADYYDLAYPWPNSSWFTGVCFVRSQVRMSDLRDGSSLTLFAGEKFVSQAHYTDCETAGDDQSCLLGDDADVRRFTTAPPVPDRAAIDGVHLFGSAHPSGAMFAFCDGSVREVGFQVDWMIFRAMGNRDDRVP